MNSSIRPLAIITGASGDLGLELARQCAAHGHDLLLIVDRPLHQPVIASAARGTQVETLQLDLSLLSNVETVCSAVRGRKVEVLIANADHGAGRSFLDEDFGAARHAIDANITGMLLLIHQIGRAMRSTGSGRILITGSMAGFRPGSFQAVYNGTKAFIDSFSWALHNELRDSGVSVTCLMPGLNDSHYFERAGLAGRRDPAEDARIGFEAMMGGDMQIVTGLTPPTVLAQQSRRAMPAHQ